jgi:hypothetical protein
MDSREPTVGQNAETPKAYQRLERRVRLKMASNRPSDSDNAVTHPLAEKSWSRLSPAELVKHTGRTLHDQLSPVTRQLIRMVQSVPDRGLANADAAIEDPNTNFRTRLFALAMLGALILFVYRASVATYYALHDSFVTPTILSPDSDLVIQSKLSLLRLETEQKSLGLRIEEARSAIEAADQALKTLEKLKSSGRPGDSRVNAHDMQTISEQRSLINQSISEQSAYVREMRNNLKAGLVRRSDVAREEAALSNLRVAALQKDRDQLSSQAQWHQSAMSQRSLLEEYNKLQQEKRSKNAELRAAMEDMATLEQMIAQMKARPVFRAIAKEQNVAFVPYSQMEGVSKGAAVYNCIAWGFISCEKVGYVVELLPGEVTLQDPWAAPTRGQYAILKLSNESAAKTKVLRVRKS